MRRICVIGGTNIDILGISDAPLLERDSNPGRISVSFGGVGRNIAQILALLGSRPQFVTCFSTDHYGVMLKNDCEALGMDCSKAVTADGVPSSIYLAILDCDHDMRMAMNDMRLLNCLDPGYLRQTVRDLDEGDMIVLDANLSAECIAAVAESAPCVIAADPVSMQKAGRFLPVLDRIGIFKPNRYEAEMLNGIVIRGPEDAGRSLDWFLGKGVKEVMISMAEDGVLIGTENDKYWLKHRQIGVANANGGGDAFLGAYVHSRAKGRTVREAAAFAAAAAAVTIEQNAVSRRTLNEKEILAQLPGMNIKELDV